MARLKDKEEIILNAAFEVFRENGFTMFGDTFETGCAVEQKLYE